MKKLFAIMFLSLLIGSAFASENLKSECKLTHSSQDRIEGKVVIDNEPIKTESQEKTKAANVQSE